MSLQHIVVVPDTHTPYEDKRAWQLMLKIIQYVKPHLVVSLGDLADFHAVSGHGGEFGRKAALETEEKALKARAGDLLSAHGKAGFVWIEGNHEQRLKRYFAQNAPAVEKYCPSYADLVLGSDVFLAKRDRTVDYRSHIDIGKVRFAHDFGHSGSNSLQQSLATVGGNCVFGHTHRLGVVYGGNDRGERHFAMSCGWLGDRNAITYMNKSQTAAWQTGCGLVTMDSKTGEAWATPIPFIRNRAVVLGTEIRIK